MLQSSQMGLASATGGQGSTNIVHLRMLLGCVFNGKLAEMYCTVIRFVTIETKINMQSDWRVPHLCQRRNSGISHIIDTFSCPPCLIEVTYIYIMYRCTYFPTSLVFGGTSANITKNARLHGHLLINGWLPDCLPISSLKFQPGTICCVASFP